MSLTLDETQHEPPALAGRAKKAKPNYSDTRWADTDRTANYASLTRGTLANMRVAGDGPPYSKRCGKVLYHLDDVDAWLRGGEQNSTSENGKAKGGQLKQCGK